MSKAAILERIRKNKPELVSLPDIGIFQHAVPEEELLADFIKISTLNMSNVVDIRSSTIPLEEFLKDFVAENFPTPTKIYDTLFRKDHLQEIDFGQEINVFMAEAKLGVAENGCLWLDEHILTQRISSFASEHSLLIIDHRNIVPTMHQAYQKINIGETGYGVFIAGPSKTADIEQSLVVGAQGAVSNTTIII